MTILEGDIQLLKSEVMADTDNGGGAATGIVIADGASNDIFPDVSELDHVYGRVSLRKVFIGIHTANTDTYLGANCILSKPPANPEVSAVLFSTGSDFDVRTDAATRIESYLAAGPSYAGYLFGNHIAGQMTVTLQQRVSVALPQSGDTIVLVKFPGTTGQVEQYVRIIDVTATQREFTGTSNGADVDFTRTIVALTISQQLEADFPGFDALYSDANVSYSGKTEILSSVVADAARYYGIRPLTSAAAFGDFGVTADGIYSQLVPSSRTEIAIPDARMNQSLDTLATTGSVITQTAGIVFDPAHPWYVGGGITPGSLSVSSGGATITDLGATLVDTAGTVIGSVDYPNGILTLASNVFGSGAGAKTVTYKGATTVTTVTTTLGLDVTEATRRMTWVTTLEPLPAAGSLQISYLSQGHWYVLTDDGSGALRGADSAFGVGVLNPTTGTVSLTLGALPDSPSRIIFAWANGASVNPVDNQGVAGANAAVITIESGLNNINMGGLTLTWGGHTVTDSTSAPGTLQGYGTGTIDHVTGRIILCPTTLPAHGDTIVVAATNLATPATGVIATLTSSGSTWTGNIGAGALAGSVRLAVIGTYPLQGADMIDLPTSAAFDITDDGVGGLHVSVPKTSGANVSYSVGSINYSTGALVLNKVVSLVVSQAHYDMRTFNGKYQIAYLGMFDRTVNWTVVNGGSGLNAVAYGYNASTLPGSTLNFVVNHLQVQAKLSGVPGSTTVGGVPTQTQTYYGALAPGASFTLGGHRYLTTPDGNVQYDPSTSAGTGTPAGTWASSTGTIDVTVWAAGAPTVSAFSAVMTPSTNYGSTTLNTSEVTFRTASSPIASAGFSIRGKLVDNTTFNVTAASDGTINTAPVFGNIDYNTGVVTLVFGASDAGPASVPLGIRDASDLNIPGLSFVKLKSANMASLVYDAVAYSYIPLDPTILGLDPVRLPSDGRVPIFKKGEVAVIHYTHTIAAASYSNGDTINLAQTRLSAATLHGSDGVAITAGFTANLDTGIITVTSISGWAQPITVTWRIEDAALITDAQLSGSIKLSRQLSHAYPLGSYVSSAFLIGDMQSHVETVFEQATWTSVWQDTPIGSPILAQYDTINHPPVVTNAAAVTESWALIFSSTTTFSIVGQHLGTLGTGSTATDCAPLNPNTGTPYFRLAAAGFGSGWAAGNVLRLDTVGALEPLWLARVVQQGDNTLDEDSFTVLVRGDIDAP